MIRSSTAFAALLAAGMAFPSAVQAPSSREPGNIVGDGDMTVQYATSGAGGGSALRTQVPRTVRITNGRLGASSGLTGGEYTEIENVPGHEAWLLGGGEDTHVVYIRPR